MSIKKIVTLQYRSIINQAAEQLQNLTVPPEGWLCTTRKALTMSGAQLARRLGVSRALVSKAEKNELSDRVTLKTMKQMSAAMGCRFVYAIVPEKTIDDIIELHATKKATEIVQLTSYQMALEGQTLSEQQIKFEVNRLKLEMIKSIPFDFWNDES